MDKLMIEDDSISVTTPEGKTISMPLEKLFQAVSPPRMDTCGVVLPEGVRLMYSQGPVTILVYVRPPGPTPLRWIAGDSPARHGSEATYRNATISLPYVVVLAAFENGTLSDYNECFFRTDRLRDDDKKNGLCYPGLLNCSRFEPPEGKPLSWICTQKLDRSALRRTRDPKQRIGRGLEALVGCLFETGFNYSSDDHEYSSWFTESRSVDERISTIDHWEEATREDNLFALEVPWLDTGKTVEQVVQRMFQNRGSNGSKISTSQQLARLVLRHAGT